MPCAWHVAPIRSACRRSLYHSSRAIRARNHEPLCDTRETTNALTHLREETSALFPGCAFEIVGRAQQRRHVDACQMDAGISFIRSLQLHRPIRIVQELLPGMVSLIR